MKNLTFPFQRLPGFLTLLLAVAYCTTGWAVPYNAVFDVDPTKSSLTVQVNAQGFSDTDTQQLDGTINATFDFGGYIFGSTADVTIPSASITSTANFHLSLGLPPLLGVAITASDLVASVSTDLPPVVMNRAPTSDIQYTVSAARFPVTVNQGTIKSTGFINQTNNLADSPVTGTSPADSMASLVFSVDTTSGRYRQLNATLNLPIDFTDSFTTDSGVVVDLHLTATVVATASFNAGLNGDFDADGDVDGRDFLLWQRDPGIGDLASWQAN